MLFGQVKTGTEKNVPPTLFTNMESEFVKQMTGSSAGNVLTAVVLFLLWTLREKCKHSRCKGHSVCCEIEINDQDSTEGRVREDVEVQVHELHEGEHCRLHGSD